MKRKENELLSWFKKLSFYVFGVPILTFLVCFFLKSNTGSDGDLAFLFFLPIYSILCIIIFLVQKFIKMFRKKKDEIVNIKDEKKEKEEKFYYSILCLIVLVITIIVTLVVSYVFSLGACLLLLPCYHCLFKFLINQTNYFLELNKKYITKEHFPFKYWMDLLFFIIMYLLYGEIFLENFNLTFNNTPLFFTFLICIVFFLFYFLRKHIELKVQSLEKRKYILLNLFNFLSFLVLFPLMAFLIILINSSIFILIELYISKLVAVIFFGILTSLFVYFSFSYFISCFRNKDVIIREMNRK